MMIKGKDRNKSAKVIDVLEKGSRVIVEGLNLLKKSVRPKKQGEKGQIISVPQAVRIENVQFVCSSCGKAARTGIKVNGDKKERYCKKCNAIV